MKRSTVAAAVPILVAGSLLLPLATPAWAQAISAPTITLTSVADTTSTAIPGGSGRFTNFIPQDPLAPGDPWISAGNVAFWGAGAGQQGIYALRYGVLGKVADLNTPIPGGTGHFVAHPPDPCISGGNVAFVGEGDGGQAGIYVGWPPSPIQPPDPVKVIDLHTIIPGGTGAFVGTPVDPCISGQNVVFIGEGASGQQGVYASFIVNVATPGDPINIADLNTAVPGGTGTFLAFGGWGTTPGAVVSGTTVAFIGASAGGGGIYVKVPVDPTGGRAAVDFNTAIPGGTGNFNQFWNLSLDGANLAFVGGVETPIKLGEQVFFEITQQGVYTVAFPGDPISPSALNKIADLNTLVPGTTATFTAFGNVAIDPQHVVFDAWYSADGQTSVHGLFTNLTGTLTELVDTTDTINGKPLADFSFGVGGFSGNQVVFAAQYADGSEGIGMATVSGNRCPLSAGYWKNHTNAWPVTSLIVGNQTYTESQLLSLLNTSTNSDASLVLARQLIAAKLDVLNFANPASVSSTIAKADGQLAQYLGQLPYSVGTNSSAAKAMLNAATLLNNYASDLLTPGCSAQ